MSSSHFIRSKVFKLSEGTEGSRYTINSLSGPGLYKVINSFFELNDKSRVSNIEELLEQYEGKEIDLLNLLEMEYN